MKLYKLGTYALLLSSTLGLSGCLNLDETAYSEIIEEDFVPTEQDVAALMASSYSPLTYIMNWQGYFDLQEESGDCIITPTRPNGWDDGGVYRRMHKHTWTNESWQPYNTYQQCYSGINNSNLVMGKIKAGTLPMGSLEASTLAELRAIRALWYSILLDTHGNVPLVTTFDSELPKQATRDSLFNFVVSELTDPQVINNLSDKVDVTTYGRMNKYAAYMTLARVYLNAEVYTGTPHWQEALDYTDSIISSQKFELSADYSDNFKKNVSYTNKECIFAVPYDVINAGFGQFAKWYPPVSKEHFGSSYQCWGGSCANPQFINSYESTDKRLGKTWLMGPQYSATDPTKLVWTCNNYLPSLTCMKDGKNYTSIDYGYRVFKYEYDATTSWNWGNDFPFYRYAEVLLMKAECLLRLHKDEDVAAQLVTDVRKRDFDNYSDAVVTAADLQGDTRIKYGTLDWDNNIDVAGDQTPVVLGGLYDEYGWEFACECQRRTTMIRFGTFSTKNWFNHEAITDGHTKLFPIPLQELQSNGNLKPNPGY